MKSDILTMNYTDSSKNVASRKTGNNQQLLHKTMDSVSMYDEDFNVSWRENDQVQVQEDEWISSVLGTEEDAIYDVLSEL